jgi:hypothetical protein
MKVRVFLGPFQLCLFTASSENTIPLTIAPKWQKIDMECGKMGLGTKRGKHYSEKKHNEWRIGNAEKES